MGHALHLGEDSVESPAVLIHVWRRVASSLERRTVTVFPAILRVHW